MTSEPEPRSRLRLYVTIMIVLAAAVTLVYWPGCRKYPVAKSPESMRLIKLLYSACSAQDDARLTQVEQEVEKAEINDAEKKAFGSITATARRGEWEKARQEAMKFAEDQVKR